MSKREEDKDIAALAAAVNGVAERAEQPCELEEHEAPELGDAPYTNAPFPTPERQAIRRNAETEDLLNGLIAECHYLMREVALPSAMGTGWEMTRTSFLRSAIDLATAGANVAGTVAKLRIADRVSPEAQGRIIDAVAQTIAK